MFPSSSSFDDKNNDRYYGGSDDPRNNNNSDLSEKLLGNFAQPEFVDEEQQQQQHPEILPAFLLAPPAKDAPATAIVVSPTTTEGTPTGSTTTPGEPQPAHFRDIFFALLFVGQLLTIVVLAVLWGLPALSYSTKNNGGGSSSSFLLAGHVLWVGVICGLTTLAGTALVWNIWQRCITQMIQLSLIFTMICQGILTVIFLLQGVWFGAVVSVIVLWWGLSYARAVWHRIPFASANLQTALTAIQANGGIALVAYGMAVASLLFTWLWLLAAVGVLSRTSSSSTSSNGDNNDSSPSTMTTLVAVLLLLSYSWTTTVLRNILSVTVAGVVGTWWFAPEDASQYCSPAIYDSWMRASTYSLGSICLGSLLAAVLQVLHQIVHSLRRRATDTHGGLSHSFLLCVLDCLASFLQRLVAYFNQYAMVYIGLYGYDYLTAGKRAYELFHNRGWTMILQDDLVTRVMLWMSLVLAGGTAVVGVVLATLWQPLRWWTSTETADGSSAVWHHATVAAGVTFVLGWALAQLLLSVVASAVDTILVTFAEAPLDLERNHPGLHRLMVTTWQQAYPDCRI